MLLTIINYNTITARQFSFAYLQGIRVVFTGSYAQLASVVLMSFRLL